MQAVVVLPGLAEVDGPAAVDDALFRRVSGVPLLVRVLATAARSGVTSVLLVRPGQISERSIRRRLRTPLTESLPVEVIAVDHAFDPTDPTDWLTLAPHLASQFLWLPWNVVTLKRSLSALVESGAHGDHGVGLGPVVALGAPAVVVSDAVLTTHRGRLDEYVRDPALPRAVVPEPMGVAVTSDRTRREAERLLVRGSGKPSDGIYSTFNRRLCRPAVRWLSNTPITANVVTLVGLAVTLVSGYWYAQGYWTAYVLGALLYFLSVLLDEVDGMLARTKFQESPFGCWLETVTDYASYLFLWAGMSIGLSRQFGTPIWLELGGLTLVMSVLIFVVLVRLRAIATTPDRPE
ncbi:MAG: CDP-alcohol phosphatidyltransferase family protein, partial [Acidobacteria bacterium]|nr:CDP-alcohol phosphatidyltransferase family protein [Acidobacteriota bacterium]